MLCRELGIRVIKTNEIFSFKFVENLFSFLFNEIHISQVARAVLEVFIVVV